MPLTRTDARLILEEIGAEDRPDFFTLTHSQVDRLLEAANLRHYRKPKNANGSRGRYFYAHVLRRAADRPFSGFVS